MDQYVSAPGRAGIQGRIKWMRVAQPGNTSAKTFCFKIIKGLLKLFSCSLPYFKEKILFQGELSEPWVHEGLGMFLMSVMSTLCPNFPEFTAKRSFPICTFYLYPEVKFTKETSC